MVFSEIPIKELRADTLTELDLKEKGIGVSGVIVLAELIKPLLRSRFLQDPLGFLRDVQSPRPSSSSSANP